MSESFKKKRSSSKSRKPRKRKTQPTEKAEQVSKETPEQKKEREDTNYTRLLLVDELFSKVDRRIADIFIRKGGSDFEKIAHYAVGLKKATEGLMLERAMAEALQQFGRL